MRHGKILALSEEFSAYDKVNVLGKGVTHIAADVSAPEPTVYSVSICLLPVAKPTGLWEALSVLTMT